MKEDDNIVERLKEELKILIDMVLECEENEELFAPEIADLETKIREMKEWQ